MLYTKEELKSMERDYNDLIKLTTKHFDLIKICEETLDILGRDAKEEITKIKEIMFEANDRLNHFLKRKHTIQKILNFNQ